MYTYLKKNISYTTIIFCIVIVVLIIINYNFPVIKDSELQNNTLVRSGTCTDVYRFSEFTNNSHGSWIYILEIDDNTTFFFSPLDLRNSRFSQLSELAEAIIGKKVHVIYLNRISLYTGAKQLISLSDDNLNYLSIDDFNRDNRVNRVVTSILCLLIPIFMTVVLWGTYYQSSEFLHLKKKIKKSNINKKLQIILNRK